jgi:hypothetical protein
MLLKYIGIKKLDIFQLFLWKNKPIAEVYLIAYLFSVFLKINFLGSCGFTNDRLDNIITENIIRCIITAVLDNKISM